MKNKHNKRIKKSLKTFTDLIALLVLPKVVLPDPAPAVRAYEGCYLWCSAAGTYPLYVALLMNSTVLANTSNTAKIRLDKEGNYSCVAANKYGTEAKHFSVIFIGKIYFCLSLVITIPNSSFSFVL